MTRRPGDLRGAVRRALCGSIGVLTALALPQSAQGQDSQTPPEPSPLQRAVTAQVSSEPPPMPEGERLELTLEGAIAIALENDLGLQIESLVADVARFEYAGSWGAFDPRLTATAAVTESEFEASSSLSGARVLEEDTQEFSANLDFPLTTGGLFNVGFNTINSRTNNSFQLVNPSTTDNLTVALRQPLLRGAWRDYATSLQREAEVVYRRELELYRQRRQELIHAVHVAYWDVVAAQEQLGVADAILNLGRQQQDQNGRRLDAGVGTEVEVLQAEANVAQRVQERLLALVNVYAANDSLKAVLFPGTQKRTWELQIVPITPLPDAIEWSVPPWESALMVALEQRAELRQQRLEIDASEIRLSRARSERKVGLDFNLSSTSGGFDGNSADAFDTVGRWEFPRNRAELVFNVPLGNRLAANNVRAARALSRSAHLVYDQRESQIAAEVRDAVRQILYQAAAVKAATVSLELARRQLAAEEARYREGLTTTFQVLEFQSQLSEALSSERRARVDYAKARVALEKAEGVLGELLLNAAAPK